MDFTVLIVGLLIGIGIPLRNKAGGIVQPATPPALTNHLSDDFRSPAHPCTQSLSGHQVW